MAVNPLETGTDINKMLNEATSTSILLAIGEMRGSMSAVASQITQVNNEIIRMSADVDAKHRDSRREIEDSKKDIALLAKEQAQKLEDHRNEISQKFDRMNRVLWHAQAFVSLLSFVAVVLGLLAALGWQPLKTEGGFRYEPPSAGPLDKSNQAP